MLTELKAKNKVVGLKQSRRAVGEGRVSKVYLADDAGSHIRREIMQLCEEKGIALESGFTMQELGEACGVEVNTAVAALLAN